MADRSCGVGDCLNSVHARGWCNGHYKKWKRWGTPTHKPPTTEERFFSHVSQSADGCWLWDHVDQGGYGTHFCPDGAGSHTLPHRWSYQHLIADIPVGLKLDHLCRNTLCVNPWHLEPVTQRVNLLRSDNFIAENAVKTHCIHDHEFTDANTYRSPGRPDRRLCRECIRIRSRKARSLAASGRK